MTKDGSTADKHTNLFSVKFYVAGQPPWGMNTQRHGETNLLWYYVGHRESIVEKWVN